MGAAAQAASFDCAKARHKVEKAICADKELSILDDRMAEAYKKRLGAWQGQVADYVRYDQREFVTLMRSADEGETEDRMDCAKAYVECIRKLMRARVQLLESEAYPMTGVYERKAGKLLITSRDGSFDVLLFDRGSNTIRSTLKYERPGMANALRKDASGYVASDLLASKLGEGVVGQAMDNPCEVRLQMSAREVTVTQGGKCGADFAGKYQRKMRDRVENYENSID
jgi:uncharacterized protein YecT (DUF1311 family)